MATAFNAIFITIVMHFRECGQSIMIAESVLSRRFIEISTEARRMRQRYRRQMRCLHHDIARGRHFHAHDAGASPAKSHASNFFIYFGQRQSSYRATFRRDDMAYNIFSAIFSPILDYADDNDMSPAC